MAAIDGNPVYHSNEAQLEFIEMEATALTKIMEEDAKSTEIYFSTEKIQHSTI